MNHDTIPMFADGTSEGRDGAALSGAADDDAPSPDERAPLWDARSPHRKGGDDAAELERRRKRRPRWIRTAAGVAGNVLEWYDFAVFGYFSDCIGDVFFPPQAGHAAVVESFVVFGGAFIMRPVGGMLMGYIGDRYGRKLALEISIFLMAFPTFAMGCLPSYERVGPWAVILLAVVRLLQGLSVGGQIMSSLVFTVEGAPKHQWGLYGSFVMAAAIFGTLVGGVVGFGMRAALSREQLRAWGWRIPFLSGILVSVSGIYLKYFCEEEEEDLPPPKSTGGAASADGAVSPPNPIRAAFAQGNRRSLLSATLVPMLWSGGFYLTFVWMATFMGDLEDPPVPAAFAVNSLSLFVSECALFQVAGILSDLHGRNRIMIAGGAGVAVLSPPLIAVIGYGSPVAAFFAQCAMGAALSLWGAPMCAWLVESFPPEVRLTSVAVGYNAAMATVGGFAPAVATVCVDRFGDGSVGYILSALAFLSLAGLVLAPRRAGEGEEGEERSPACGCRRNFRKSQ